MCKLVVHPLLGSPPIVVLGLIICQAYDSPHWRALDRPGQGGDRRGAVITHLSQDILDKLLINMYIKALGGCGAREAEIEPGVSRVIGGDGCCER